MEWYDVRSLYPPTFKIILLIVPSFSTTASTATVRYGTSSQLTAAIRINKNTIGTRLLTVCMYCMADNRIHNIQYNNTSNIVRNKISNKHISSRDYCIEFIQQQLLYYALFVFFVADTTINSSSSSSSNSMLRRTSSSGMMGHRDDCHGHNINNNNNSK